MKKLEFKTSNGEFVLEEASDKNLGRVLVKHMTNEQFAEVVDSELDSHLNPNYKDYLHDYTSGFEDEYIYYTAKESFESLIKSLGWYLFENPVSENPSKERMGGALSWYQAESKTFYNPILLKKV